MSTPVGKCIAALKTSFSNIIDLSITSLFSNKFWLSMHRKCNNLASFFDLPIRVFNLLGQSHMKFQSRVTSQIWCNDWSHDSQHPIIMLYTQRFCNEIASWINPKSLDPKLSPFLTQLSDVQVINAARVLAARPKSKVAQENMDVFKDAWINQVQWAFGHLFLASESTDSIFNGLRDHC